MEGFAEHEDRCRKYGMGSVRLLVVVGVAACAAGSSLNTEYIATWSRLATHVYIGVIGALINTSTLPFRANVALLLGGLAAVVSDVWWFDLTLGCYLLKTTVGDTLAGKVDSAEWRLGLAGVVGGVAAAAAWGWSSSEVGVGDGVPVADAVTAYGRIFVVLAAVQFVCEYGDGHLEHLVFFRHRYSFELLTAAVLLVVPLTREERRVVEFDLVICLCYRLANYVILMTWAIRAPQLLMLIFKLFGVVNYGFFGRRFMRVTDPHVATLVLKASVDKGDCVERRIATPAWSPILSLESIDGERWRRMRHGFSTVLDLLSPRIHELSAITQRQTDELLKTGVEIGAVAITRLTVGIFLEFLFHRRDFGAAIDVLAEASWEWRKEIACKGKGRLQSKQAAVTTIVALIRSEPELWSLFGEEWADPERYSLLLQPFLISPAINTCDIMVGIHRAGKSVSLDDAVRRAHPFPILERYVADPIVDESGKVIIPGDTQVLFFANDFESTVGWPIFSSGRRSCAGMHFARGYLTVLRSSLLGHPRFRPEAGHRFSGRNNDRLEWGELVYLICTVPVAIFGRSKQT